MSTELIPASTTAIVQPKEGSNVSVSTLHPRDMEHCQNALIEWAAVKCREVKSDVLELTEALEHARQQKWKTSTIARHLAKARKRFSFYSKIKSALEHGYVIVPNFPVTLFAIRTDDAVPDELPTIDFYATHEQKSAELPEGEADYKNPFPKLYTRLIPSPTKELPDRTRNEYCADEWRDLEFPVSMSKLTIMEATTNAMALKIFDEFGILPEKPKQDPIIVAKIIRREGYNKREVTFMIAWNLDTRIL